MVIQPNMSPRAIVKVWEETRFIFDAYQVPLTEQPLEQLLSDTELEPLLKRLNNHVNSSSMTCTEGG
ncbi:hypothetical protein E3U55_10180 [Filobacillus milosensis]|uniref:Uncharacterized protein n=1 Tax=Filobacillus milosensis TaxID=94137 RepID=A0A4Y8IFT9_9BACI|nr:hypothetical protein [Filobacillus milosensis]TFB19523.1 hypothetical protein E3U55_10180 [Filobacillus milosensis]